MSEYTDKGELLTKRIKGRLLFSFISIAIGIMPGIAMFIIAYIILHFGLKII